MGGYIKGDTRSLDRSSYRDYNREYIGVLLG